MKKIFILVFLFALSSATPAKKFELYTHDNDKDIVSKSMNLEDYITGEKSENEHFKVVIGNSSEAVRLDDSSIPEKIRKKAATVIFHLTKAKKNLIERLDSKYITNLPQAIIRIEMDKVFNPFTKYVKNEDAKIYNNSVTIPSSGMKKMNDVEQWQPEIWFRPKKEIDIDNVVSVASEMTLLTGSTEDTVMGIADEMTVALVSEFAVTEEFSMGVVDYHMEQLVSTFVISRILPYTIKAISSPFKSNFYLDTAAIPEIIYHEFIHLALADSIPVNTDSLVGEGYANYFAAMIHDDYALGQKTGDHGSNAGGYDGKFRMAYRDSFETKGNEHNGFVYTLLVSFREDMASLFKNREEGLKVADKIVYESRKYLEYTNTPVKDMTRAIGRAVKKIGGAKKRALYMTVQRTANKFGI